MSFDLDIQDFETNAQQRAAQPRKIRRSDTYNGLIPGNLGLKVYYAAGCLNVHLGKAKLSGKQSQDPYALVYLLDETNQKCYFQRGNKQTDVFDRNITPNFNKTFYFKMDMQDIARKSLVVAVWDQDSTSRDDYMAGIRIGLRDIRSFEKREINVNLLHQDDNGHPAMLTGNIEKKIEAKAQHRATQQKIKGPSAYGAAPHGTLKFKVDYFWGFLHVHVEEADLSGKRSQDPFALVYLLDQSTGLATMQIDNNRTKTFDKSLKPNFSHDFYFRMRREEVQSKLLVVAIWDDDSGKSHDDYMEGIRFTMNEFSYFEKLGRSVEVQLKHQESDGHPAKLSYQEIDSLFLIRKTDPKMDLKTCNDSLISFIERARVLSEAIEIKQSLPSSLSNSTSVSMPNIQQILEAEINSMRNKMSSRKAELARGKSTLGNLRTKNIEYEEEYKRKQQTFMEIEQRIFSCESYNARSITLPYKEQERQMEGLDTIDFGQSSKHMEMMERITKIKTEYENKMQGTLGKIREDLNIKYQSYFLELERKANEIMEIYEQMIEVRTSKNPEYRLQMLELEKRRNYEKRISDLSADIRTIELKTKNLKDNLNVLGNQYTPQMRAMDEEMERLKVQLRELFNRMIQFAMTRYDEKLEIEIFGHLLSNEDTRFQEEKGKRQKSVTVRKSVSDRRTGSVAEASRNSSQTFNSRRESGYFSPDRARTPDNTLDPRRTQLFENLKDDVF